MNKEQVELELRLLIDEVTKGHEKLLAGEDFGLQGINRRIEAACQAALALPNEEVVEMHPLMQELRTQLQDFSANLNEAMDRAGMSDAPASTEETPDGSDDKTGG
ncbi:hypothetical protein EOI86_17445 [Hwanghaeella grinnelliae]|uniref:Uncharacterized protein n=1 Tax=Hwanghaeella grinnelliae TaxID=2500179 RepID=A0A3S2Y0Z3_9PROT|nr:hypothetical protein [Hwanghaeella grinnelliae]RVU34642.1 hypothetical protein EOI86_17445 [Hwanghaeella grinnelliae]